MKSSVLRFSFNTTSLALVAVIALSTFCILSADAQSTAASVDSRASASIAFGGGGSIGIRGLERFPFVEIGAGEMANIQLQLPARFANTRVSVQAVDGGVASKSLVIATDGTGSFTYQAGVQPGLYRILLSGHGKTIVIRFWVPNSDPSANPPMLTRSSD